MTIPGNLLSNDRPESPLLAPDDRQRTDPLQDWERGGVALNDPSQGHDVRDWKVWSDGLTIWVAPDPELTPRVAVQTGADITEVSLGFDQNMQPTVAYVDGGVTKLWWYDTVGAAMTTTTYPGYKTPMLTLDDKRDIATQTGVNDIIFAYVRDDLLCWRQQRERYTVERVLGPVPYPNTRIIGMGMSTGNRLQVKLSVPTSASHVDISSGDMFLVSGDAVLQVDAGAVPGAVWRSRIYVFDTQPSFAWARVEADGPATVRVYADGSLIHTKFDVASNTPFRLPAKKAREWYVEIAGVARVVAVTLASSTAELGR